MATEDMSLTCLMDIDRIIVVVTAARCLVIVLLSAGTYNRDLAQQPTVNFIHRSQSITVINLVFLNTCVVNVVLFSVLVLILY